MKTPLRLLVAAAIGAAAVSSNAQTPAPSAEPPPKPPGQHYKERLERMTERLPEDVRDRFREIHQEVMSDPKIQELRQKAETAGREFRDAMRDAMRERDPELAEKVEAHFKQFKSKDGAPKPWKEQMENAVKALPPEEKDRFEKAREIAKQAPAVQAAESKMKASQTPEERQAAAREFHEAMRAAMLTADPSLGDVLDKVGPPRKAPEPAPEKAE